MTSISSGGGGGYDYVEAFYPADADEGESLYHLTENAAFVYSGTEWIEQTVTDHSQLSGVNDGDHRSDQRVSNLAPLQSVNGRTGHVSGLFEASDYTPEADTHSRPSATQDHQENGGYKEFLSYNNTSTYNNTTGNASLTQESHSGTYYPTTTADGLRPDIRCFAESNATSDTIEVTLAVEATLTLKDGDGSVVRTITKSASNDFSHKQSVKSEEVNITTDQLTEEVERIDYNLLAECDVTGGYSYTDTILTATVDASASAHETPIARHSHPI